MNGEDFVDAVSNSQSFAEIIRHLASVQPERIALSFEGRETTYSAFDKHTNQVANALIAAGVQKGDRVGYFGLMQLVFLGGNFLGKLIFPVIGLFDSVLLSLK